MATYDVASDIDSFSRPCLEGAVSAQQRRGEGEGVAARGGLLVGGEGVDPPAAHPARGRRRAHEAYLGLALQVGEVARRAAAEHVRVEPLSTARV